MPRETRLGCFAGADWPSGLILVVAVGVFFTAVGVVFAGVEEMGVVEVVFFCTVVVAFGVVVSFFTATGKGFFVPSGVRGFDAALIGVLLVVTGVFFTGVEETAGFGAEVAATGFLGVAEDVETGLTGVAVFAAGTLGVEGSVLTSFLGFLLTG